MECFHGVLGRGAPLDPSARWQGAEADLIVSPGTRPAGGEKNRGMLRRTARLRRTYFGSHG